MLVFLLHSMKLLFTKPIPPNPAPSKIIPIISETLYIYLIGFQIDWRVGIDKLKSVDDQIDIGLRICQEPELDWVAQHICTFSEKIVASPALLKRLNFPKDLQDLAQNYPLSGLIDPKLKLGNGKSTLNNVLCPTERYSSPLTCKANCNQLSLGALVLIL